MKGTDRKHNIFSLILLEFLWSHGLIKYLLTTTNEVPGPFGGIVTEHNIVGVALFFRSGYSSRPTLWAFFFVFASSSFLFLCLNIKELVTHSAWAGLISLSNAWACSFSHWPLRTPSQLHSNPMLGQASQISHIDQRSAKEKRLIFISICV